MTTPTASRERRATIRPGEGLDQLRHQLIETYTRIRRNQNTSDMRLVQSIQQTIREATRDEASLAAHTLLRSWPCAQVQEPGHCRQRPLFMVCRELNRAARRDEPLCEACPLRSICHPPWML